MKLDDKLEYSTGIGSGEKGRGHQDQGPLMGSLWYVQH